jgi:PAS domain-containing protein
MNDIKKFTDSNFATTILEKDKNPSLYRRFPSILLIIFILLSAGICYLGFLYYLNFKEKITENAENELHSVGVMKVNEILSWKEELLEDAENISKNPLIINDLVYYFNNKNKVNPNNTNQINYWLESLTKLYKFNCAILYDTSGNNCLSYPQNIIKDSYEDNIILRNSLNQRKINFSDIHFPDSDSNRLAFDLFIPILVVNEKDTVSAGVVTLEIDPRIYLFPTIQKWPSPSNTAEALLIEKSGSDVLYLNDLRHLENSALRLKIPLNKDNLPAAQILKGKTGFTEGIDYRGVEVFASLHQLPGTPWSLVTKIDKDEVFSGLAKRALWIAGYALLLIILSGSAIAFYWRQQKFTFFRKQYELELEKQALTKHYNYMFKYANDIIILTDEKWNILEVNDKAISVYGYTKEELLKLKLVDLRVNKSDLIP